MDFLLKWWCSEMPDPICKGEMWYGDTPKSLFRTILYYYCEKFDCDSSRILNNGFP